MVRIGDRILDDIPCVIPVIAEIIKQYAHQLRHAQYRMRIVELDGDLLMQIIQIRIVAQVSANDLVDAGADKEIFLFQTQQLSMLRGIIRVNVLRDLIHFSYIFAQFVGSDKIRCDLRIP